MTETINKKEKEPKSIGEIIMPIVVMLLFFGIPIAYYWDVRSGSVVLQEVRFTGLL